MAKQRAVIEKIKKLLALSDLEKNNNVNEALNAACTAQSLMDKHRLSYEKIMFEASGLYTSKDEIIDYIKHFGTYFGMPDPSEWSRALVKIIAEHNDCRCYTTKLSRIGGDKGEKDYFTALSLVGREENIYIVEEIYFYLELEISKICIQEWSKLEGAMDAEASKKWRADFCLGAVAQLLSKFEELKKIEVGEEHKHAIIRLEQKRLALDSFFASLKFEKNSGNARATSPASFNRGYRAAEKIPIQLDKTKILEV